MLILTRRVGESLRISDDIVVTVLDVKGNQIRIGIEAPSEMKVLRKDCLNAKSRPMDWHDHVLSAHCCHKTIRSFLYLT